MGAILPESPNVSHDPSCGRRNATGAGISCASCLDVSERAVGACNWMEVEQ